MSKRKFLIFTSLVLAVAVVAWSFAPALAQNNGNVKDKAFNYHQKMSPSERKAAAANAKAKGQQVGVTATTLIDPGSGLMVPDYFGSPNWAFSPPLTKFVDKLAGLGPANANLLGQFIPIAVPDTTAYAGSHYYEIALVEFNEQLHLELPLPGTRHRGYVQIVPQGWSGTDLLGNLYNAVPLTTANGLTQDIMINGVQAYGASKPHFLGPAIVAMGAYPGGTGVPVRIKFYNLLPYNTNPNLMGGKVGDLFIPVDTTVMGAGMGPLDMPMMPGMKESYTQNRATVHLHGNNTVWISDGTPHQWITPAGEATQYPQGVSVQPVPDMNAAPANDTGNPTDGTMTFYYTNAQSARLMFYHDHAYGITRLNVYVGEAAAYVITDEVEQDLINGTNKSGVNIPNPLVANPDPNKPGDFLKVLPDIGIPLVIQDRTFVDATPVTDPVSGQVVPAISLTDPTWLDPLQNTFGTTPGVPNHGDLWYPHVYMPAQNPWDISGANAFGRWMYGPWFYPPTANLAFGPIPNPYCQPSPPPDALSYPNGVYDCSGTPWEPPYMPATPNPSMPGEAFMDTMMVNGTVFPYMEVEPKAYRFRILNAGDDRSLNLQLYVAADKNSPTTATTSTGAVLCDGITGVAVGNCTEVKMVPVTGTDWLPPFDFSGVPDPTTAGPDWWQIGTEGGFLPAPAVITSQPITWNTNPTAFNFGNVVGHSLLLGTAERADVIVDFSAFAGKTLILYNDAPAAFPAPDPRYDYYTGAEDQTSTGGAPPTLPGKGPNTRTIMQIRVAGSASTVNPDVTLANLNAVWAKTASKRGVFERSQDPIIIPQAAYNSAYNNTFTSAPAEEYIQVNIYSKTFKPIDATGALQSPVTLPIEPKAVHDEMGGVYDTKYGRMSGMLGLELPATTSRLAQFLPYGYASPPVDLIKGVDITATPIVTLGDGTQIWNISQNGVDTHTIHTHLFNAQLINRVGWDGAMIPPDPNELGWKETFRVNPLEQTFIALRPILPTLAQVPFLNQIPNSVRLIDPTMPENDPLDEPPPAGWFDPLGNQLANPILNHKVNFGWEYVYHCHILAHEEMDMMHATAFAVPPAAPTGLTATLAGNGNNKRAVLTWADNSLNETGFTIQRSTNIGFAGTLTTFAVGPNVTTFTNTIGNTNQTYYYRVFASNTVGDVTLPNFPTMTVDSGFSKTAGVNLPPNAPINVLATAFRFNTNNDRVTVTWTDNSNNETGFRIQWATDLNFNAVVGTSTVGANVQTFTTGNLPRGATYFFRVQAYNASGTSAYVNASNNPITTP